MELELSDQIPGPLAFYADEEQPAAAAAARDHNGTRANSRVYSVFLLLNSMIGSGVFNIPHVFRKAGLVSSYFLLTFSAVLVYAGLIVLVAASEQNPQKELGDYAALASSLFQTPFAGHAVDFFIAIVGFGSMMSYISGISSMVHELLTSWESAASVYVVTTVIMVGAVFPLCLQRYYGHFSFISVLSMSSVCLVLCLVVIGGPLYSARYASSSSSSSPSTPALFRGNPIQQLGSVIFTFSCASATFHTYKYMKTRTEDEWRIVCRITVFFGWLLCVLMGTGGYLSFGEDTDGIILANFRRGHVGDFFQMLFIAHLVLYIPLDFLVARHSLLRVCGVEQGVFRENKLHVIFCFLLLALFTGIIFLLDASGMGAGDIFSAILNFTGGLGGSVISFVFPAALFLRLHLGGGIEPKMRSLDQMGAVFMFAVGVVVAIYVPILTVLHSMHD